MSDAEACQELLELIKKHGGIAYYFYKNELWKVAVSEDGSFIKGRANSEIWSYHHDEMSYLTLCYSKIYYLEKKLNEEMEYSRKLEEMISWPLPLPSTIKEEVEWFKEKEIPVPAWLKET